MTPFVKLDCGILDSSIWSEDDATLRVWITLLLMADVDGVVEAAIPGIAKRAFVSVDAVVKAIEKFELPDKWSKNQENEGRRIERIKCGYQILNYQEYRKKDHTAAARQRRHRELSRSVTSVTRDVTVCHAPYASASSSVSSSLEKEEKKKEKRGIYRERFDLFWKTYPRKVGKHKAMISFFKISPDEKLFDEIIAAVEFWKMTENWKKDGGQFIPHPTTWLNGKRWEDEKIERKKTLPLNVRVTEWDEDEEERKAAATMAAQKERRERLGIDQPEKDKEKDAL